MKSRFSGLVGVLLIALAGSLLTVPATAAPPARAATPQAPAKQRWLPPTGGLFNDPWGSEDAKYRVERHIVDAIRHARKGS